MPRHTTAQRSREDNGRRAAPAGIVATSAHAGSAILQQKFSVAGKNDDRRRHLGEWMQRILLTIAGNREWHHNLGGLTRIVDQEELDEL